MPMYVNYVALLQETLLRRLQESVSQGLQDTVLHGLQETASPVWVVGEACAGLVERQLQLIKHQEGVQVAQLGCPNLQTNRHARAAKRKSF
jgi:hypothetical protein